MAIEIQHCWFAKETRSTTMTSRTIGGFPWLCWITAQSEEMAIGKKYFWSLKIPTKAPATKRTVEVWDSVWCIVMQNIRSMALFFWVPSICGCIQSPRGDSASTTNLPFVHWLVCLRCQWSNAARQTWRQGTQRRTASPKRHHCWEVQMITVGYIQCKCLLVMRDISEYFECIFWESCQHSFLPEWAFCNHPQSKVNKDLPRVSVPFNAFLIY